MKSANDWCIELGDSHPDEPPAFYELVEFVNKVQTDAYKAGLLRAAQICREVYEQPSLSESEKYISRICADRIESKTNPHHD